MKSRSRLRVLRAERDLSQIDTAVKAKIGRFRYWQIEKGYMDPTPKERADLARVLKIAEDELFPQEAVAS